MTNGDHETSAGATVLFVCPHGAGKSRIAAAWFAALAPVGWTATSAGILPQPSVSVHAPRLLAGTAAATFLDSSLPRPLSAVPDATLMVAIDCPVGAVSADVVWPLTHREFGAQMAAELRARVEELVGQLGAASAERDGAGDG